MTNLTAEAEARFAYDHFATDVTGITIGEAGDHHAICHLQIDPTHCNAMGAVMGGAIFTLADFAFAIAANSRSIKEYEPLEWVSVSSNIQYLRQARNGMLHAEAKCVKEGKSTCVYSILVTDDQEREIALITTTGMKVNI
ncbi:MAG: PaaI family thioesterase [Bacteroidales bacterium]|nr:PaaI family thioesterase [Bacteroidales bacterium]